MKRLLCMLLAAFLIFLLCACADKKDDPKDGKDTEPSVTQTSEEKETDTPEEVVTAPDSGDSETEKPDVIGTLPIIFEEDKKEDSSGDTPPTTTTATTKKPTVTTTAPQGNSSGVLETPIIPFN